MDTKKYFLTRRTIRKYDQDKPLPIEQIRDMLQEAAHAANTGNMQLYSVVVTTEREIIEKLAPAHFNQPAVRSAKAVLTFCMDINRFNRWCAMNNAIPGMGNLQGFTWGVIDTSIYAQQFCTIAEMNGLGTCYLGTTTYNAPEIQSALDLPFGVVPIITVTTGYPAESPTPQDRLPNEAIVHIEKYHVPSDSEIAGFYKEKEGLEESQKFVIENTKENLAQVYADVRYPKDANEHFSEVYKEFLMNQGIAL